MRSNYETKWPISVNLSCINSSIKEGYHYSTPKTNWTDKAVTNAMTFASAILLLIMTWPLKLTWDLAVRGSHLGHCGQRLKLVWIERDGGGISTFEGRRAILCRDL